MGYAEHRGTYYRARYKIAPGKYGTVQDAAGETIRFRTKREAEKAANNEEAKVRDQRRQAATPSQMSFGAYASDWYASQDLAASTMQNYRRHIEEHLLPTFQDKMLDEISRTDINAWEKEEKAAGYALSSVKTWRATLHLILEDAYDEELIDSNPATKRRGRGKRAGRSRHRSPEKVITDPLGLLLIAERAAILSGRDDEFVAITLMGYTGMRWGEVVGLETGFVRPESIRVEWQLYELDTGELVRCPPKDDSYRTIDSPEFLWRLVSDHTARITPSPCSCHSLTYVFRGLQPANRAAHRPGAKLVDVARLAGVSAATVSTFLNRPDVVAQATQVQVKEAITRLGYVRSAPSGEPAAHWRRNGFATWLFHPAATGWYPKKAPHDARPVPLLGEPWPGVPVRGRNAAGRANTCWTRIGPGLTPHGLRHTHKTRMRGLGTPPKLMDERMGHLDGTVQARYDHITHEMRMALLAGLTAEWEAALDARRAMCPSSPVTALDELLRSL
ncbi:LacI family DNA-binding transcriptional regulator [Kibdelosporangium phytohabitans]|uniref:LacI family transcriptional regulator n=1 Tax=Kibdelosporangium phytohabitans TaxID=860235 RepID=A0A0N7F2G8_9PSEU|nr:LacI family DNA-binding transcriptional regulator [Kibdelosporangium phytohabitans]ALG05791.1 LacI family transcriptional regulator [Kibdelosporangium phytohabitans]MBE1466200.1 integrase [Kibdelosporangium phytohabitans]